MNRVGVLLIAMSALAMSACDSRKVEEPQLDSQVGGMPKEAAANKPAARRVLESDCLDELLPSLGLGSGFSLTRSGDTVAGCEFAGTADQAAGELATTLSGALSQKDYSLQDSVGAKGGTRLSFTSSDGLAMSALIRDAVTADGEGEGVRGSRLDLHWYDPARLED